MTPDPVSLRLFLFAVETGSIAAAAQRLHIVTSAASKRISELEATLGVQLLRRLNRGVEPTAAGDALVSLARRALADLEDIRLQIQDFSSGIRGHVSLLASISAIAQFLPADLAAFAVSRPEIDLHVEEGVSTAIVKAVAENVADIAVSVPVRHPYELTELPYREYRIVALVPADHRLARRHSVRFIETLDESHIGLRADGTVNRFLGDRASELGRTIRYRIHVESYDAMALMVEAGLGIGIVPKGIARPYSRGFKVRTVALADDWAARQLLIYFTSFDRLSAAARLLVDHLRANDGAAFS